MPPKRKAASKAAVGRTRRSARRKPSGTPEIPNVYQDMLLEEAAAATSGTQASSPTVKRRKLDCESDHSPVIDSLPDYAPTSPEQARTSTVQDEHSTNEQIVYGDYEDSQEDMEFEDVDLALSDAEDRPEQKVLTVELDGPLDTPSKRAPRRPVVSAAERKVRLEWHKAHLFLLVLSVWIRNRWCENQEVQQSLRALVPRKTIKLLHEDESKPQVQRSYSFNKGIEDISLLWRTTWTVTGRGMRRAYWRDDIDMEKERDLAEEVDFDDFKSAAQTLCGSRDLGAQLFCALLRSVAVEARLVCSLQVLPFSASTKGHTPAKPMQDYIHAPSQDFGSSGPDTPRRKHKDSPYPIYWVEAFSPFSSTWIPLDPIVRHTINKPKTGFEPPGSDLLNAMAYVVAFEDDGSARDVTRRYAQWFNAKTRKQRLESTRGGEASWQATMARFAKPFRELRDEQEDADLLRRSEAEGMPKNVQDFRGHPIYVLERHLRLNEVIEPKREVGKTHIGSGQKSQRLESVYRRRDVYLCRSAQAWYRRGRDVKQGEVPVKRVTRKVRRNGLFDEDDVTNEDDTTLYAEFQTEVYVPPPIEEGQVPRNNFGNIDIYVPSMIPAGAVHVQHPLAAKASKLMGINYVEAVTGFDFKGRQGTAIINGVVVPAETRFGLVTVIVGMQNEAVAEARAQRTAILLALWKRWLTALRIRERIQREYGDEDDDDEDNDTYIESDRDFAGGFMPGDAEQPDSREENLPSDKPPDTTSKILLQGLPAEPATADIIVVESPHRLFTKPQAQSHAVKVPQVDSIVNKSTNDEAGGFFAYDEDSGGGFIIDNDDTVQRKQSNRVDDVEDNGGSRTMEGSLNISPDDNVMAPQQHRDEALSTLQEPDLAMPFAEPERGSPHPVEIEGLMVRLKRWSSSGLSQSQNLGLSQTQQGENDLPESQPPPDISKTRSNDHSVSDAEDHASASSMLSHDPDEDDMEPDWLVASLGD